jgi:glycosyltransferase involved in cell wall biosynthesis
VQAEQSWLLVSKPLRAPYRDGSTVLLRTLAQGLDERLELSYFGDPKAPVRRAGGGEIIEAPAMGYAPGLLAKARILTALLSPRRRRLGLHFFFTPNRVTSGVVAALRLLQPGRRMVQNLMSSHDVARHLPLLRALDAVVVLSDHTRDELSRAGLEPERIFRIYPGVDTVDGIENPADNRAVLYAGDLDANVVDHLVEIARIFGRQELSGWRMFIAARPKGEGDGEHRSRLARSLAEELESGRVVLREEVGDMDGLMRRCSLQVFVADHVRRKVDLPLVLLEGMARGLGLVTLDFEPVSEIFGLARANDLEPGVSVARQATPELPEILAQAMASPETLLRWGRDARELVHRELSSARMIREYEKMYEEIRGRA